MQASRNLLEFLSTRAGSAVRAVAYYEDDDIEMLHIKDDVDEHYDAEEFGQMASLFGDDVDRSRAEDLFELGEFNVSLLGFHEGLLLHFPRGERSGTVVSLEADAAPRFNRFVDECADRIYGQ